MGLKSRCLRFGGLCLRIKIRPKWDWNGNWGKMGYIKESGLKSDQNGIEIQEEGGNNII